jgi:hypothetical protein
VVRGLRNVLEAAIYGQLTTGAQSAATALVTLKDASGNELDQCQLYASRLRNPRDPSGAKTVMAAGDLVAVASASGSYAGEVLYTVISSGNVTTQTLAAPPSGGTPHLIGDDIRLWTELTARPQDAVVVRFLNRYDVPQTMMTVRPLEIKPGYSDQTGLMNGQHMRFSVEQNDEYTMRSGRIHSMREYASWYDLITSRRAEVQMNGVWLPIVVTKSNVSIVSHSEGLNPVELTFRMADPRQGF